VDVIVLVSAFLLLFNLLYRDFFALLFALVPEILVILVMTVISFTKVARRGEVSLNWEE